MMIIANYTTAESGLVQLIYTRNKFSHSAPKLAVLAKYNAVKLSFYLLEPK